MKRTDERWRKLMWTWLMRFRPTDDATFSVVCGIKDDPRFKSAVITVELSEEDRDPDTVVVNRKASDDS